MAHQENFEIPRIISVAIMAAILWLSLWLDKLLISCSMYSLLVRKQEPLIEFSYLRYHFNI